MTKVITKKDNTIKDLLIEKQTDIASLLPSHVNIDRFMKSALLAVARDSKLQECTPKSVFTAIVNAAEVGLDFTPIKGFAYLIPYKNVATFMPGYRGLIHLALQGGKVKQIDADLVYEKDLFKMTKGTSPALIHEPYLDGDRGNLKGAYAVAFYNDGTPAQFVYMNIEQLDAVKNVSKSKNSEYSPYKSFPDEMRRKAPVRRLFKYLPSSPDEKLEKALEYDSKASGIEFLPTGNGEDRISRTAQLADTLSTYSEQEKKKETEQKIEIKETPVQDESKKELPPDEYTEQLGF